LSPHHEKAKQNTIGVARRINAKLPHCTGFMLTYPMENKMPFIHHTIECWRCGYIIENDKGLNEKIEDIQ
jgi:hypothetical protein